MKLENRIKDNYNNNKGFSLIELIIVVAIMAVLVCLITPQYLRYVERAKRVVDVDTARKIYDAATRVQALDPVSTYAGGLPSASVAWNKDCHYNDPPRTWTDYVFIEIGELPISAVDNTLVWTMDYEPDGRVKAIYLGRTPGDRKYELYPDSSAWLKNGAN